MPYELKQQDGKWCVFNKDTGDNKGCSDTREMGVKHMRALYVNESKELLKAFEELDSELVVTSEDSLASKIVNGIKGLFDKPTSPVEAGPITCIKQQDGRVRVMMRMSNMFKDRHGEIITSEAHKEYEAYVSRSGDFPVFKLWHWPASRWGQADLVSFDDGFLTVSGLADEGKEYIAESLASQKDIGVSHGFRGISIQGKGYIDWYRTFEASPLPRSEAANVWTAYMIAKSWKDNMGLADKHKTWFANLGVPEEIIHSWDTSNKEIGQLLKESGIDFKEFNEAVEGTKQSAAMHRAMAAFHTQAAGTDAEDNKEAPEGSKPDAEDKAEGKEKKEAGDYATLNSKIDGLTKAVEGLVTAHKALDTKVKDAVGDTLAATIVPGKGFVASKDGSAPSETEKKQNDEWLLDLITGAK